jgi:hypothetical protein
VIAGAGESGKSTVLKQMKLIYAQGFSKNEKLEWKPVIFGNIVQSFRLIFDAMNEMGIKFDIEENEASSHPCSGPITTWPRPSASAAERHPALNGPLTGFVRFTEKYGPYHGRL